MAKTGQLTMTIEISAADLFGDIRSTLQWAAQGVGMKREQAESLLARLDEALQNGDIRVTPRIPAPETPE